MVTYPIRIVREHYRGKIPSKRLQVAEHNRMVDELERKINDMLRAQTAPTQTYTWASLAHETGIPVEFIRKVGGSIDGGHNGFTATAPGAAI